MLLVRVVQVCYLRWEIKEIFVLPSCVLFFNPSVQCLLTFMQIIACLQLLLSSPAQPGCGFFHRRVKFSQCKHFLLSKCVLICYLNALIFLSTLRNGLLHQELGAHTSKHLHITHFLNV